jgi:protein TonB
LLTADTDDGRIGGRPVGRALAVSIAAHGAILLGLIALVGIRSAGEEPPRAELDPPLTFVHVVSPVPSGGGGGTLRASAPDPTRIPPQKPVNLTPTPASTTAEPPPMPQMQLSVHTDTSALLHVSGTSLLAPPGPGGRGRGTGAGDGDGPGLNRGSGGEQGGGPRQIGDDVTPPDIRIRVEPGYTQDAMLKKVQGVVLLEVVVRANGTVGSMRVVRSLTPDLDQSAMQAVRRWLFTPARHKGQPVDVLVYVELTFRLH